MSARSFDINKTTKQGNIKVLNQLGFKSVLLHDNCVLTVEDNTSIKLHSCGYRTNTTKLAINNALKQLKQPFHVSQEKFEWYVYYKGEKLGKFQDGMSLNME